MISSYGCISRDVYAHIFIYFLNLFILIGGKKLYNIVLVLPYITLTWIRHGCTRVPHPELPSHLPPLTIPLGHPSASAPGILYQASNLETGDSFHIWYSTCLNAILPNHPTLALSHRVHKTVLYISVSFAVSHTGLLLPSF